MAIDFKPVFMAKMNIEDIFRLMREAVHQQYGPHAEVNISFSGALQDSSLSATVIVETPPHATPHSDPPAAELHPEAPHPHPDPHEA